MMLCEPTPTQAGARQLRLELRTGDVLEINGARIELQYKKGQAARMLVQAAPDVAIKKIPAVVRAVPSLPT
jgi:hypothetical protein